MSSFALFAQDAAADSRLARDFVQALAAGSVEVLKNWFGARGYFVDEDDCRRLLDNTVQGNRQSAKDHVSATY